MGGGGGFKSFRILERNLQSSANVIVVLIIRILYSQSCKTVFHQQLSHIASIFHYNVLSNIGVLYICIDVFVVFPMRTSLSSLQRILLYIIPQTNQLYPSCPNIQEGNMKGINYEVWKEQLNSFVGQ